jgi:class 3 adenylate cyclase
MAKDRWIGGAVKRPGRVKNAAKRDGISVTQEAHKMAESPDKSRAAAGRLALRFKGVATKGNIRKPKNKRKGTSLKK